MKKVMFVIGMFFLLVTSGFVLGQDCDSVIGNDCYNNCVYHSETIGAGTTDRSCSDQYVDPSRRSFACGGSYCDTDVKDGGHGIHLESIGGSSTFYWYCCDRQPVCVHEGQTPGSLNTNEYCFFDCSEQHSMNSGGRSEDVCGSDYVYVEFLQVWGGYSTYIVFNDDHGLEVQGNARADFRCCDRILTGGGCTNGETRSCGSDVGECSFGTETCSSGSWGACVGAVNPSTEVCDGLDNDCDGVVDEGVVCQFLTWQNMNGEEITEADRGDTVQMVVTSLSSGSFDIWEDDPVSDDYIKNIVGENVGDDLIGRWVISQEDLSKTSGDYSGFFFEASDVSDNSNFLSVNSGYDDSPMNVTIVSPGCGLDFDEGSVLMVEIDAIDEDDIITGRLKVNGFEENFTNGGIVVNYTLNKPGNLKIIAEAENTRGKMARSISNVMILDKQGGNYVDGKYVAACIKEPKDFMYFSDSIVDFDASTTRAIEVVGGVIDRILPGSYKLGWYWTFTPEDGGEVITRNFVGRTDSLPYIFSAEFPTSGSNSASLRVVF